MKRFLTMLLLVAATSLTISCESTLDDLLGHTNEEIKSEKEGKTAYNGEMKVSKSGKTTYTNDNATFYAGVEDEKISIFMEGVKFATMMPVKIDILVSDIEMDGTEFSIDSIIPTVEGDPMPKRTLYEVKGYLDGDKFNISFVCDGYDVVFSSF